MTNELKCQMCLKQYSLFHQHQDHSTNNQVPLLLICGHTFCHKCLTRLYDKKNGIFCPICGTQTECLMDKTGIKGLYPNMCALGYLALKDLKSLNKLQALNESLQKKKILKRSSSLQNCSECMLTTAAVSCVQCGVNICDDCFKKIHQNSRVLKRHQAIPISKSAHNLSSLDCKKHHALADNYCVDDGLLICFHCIHDDHQNHKIISLQEKSKEVAPAVKQSLKKINVIMSNLEKYVLEIEDEIGSIQVDAAKKANDILEYFMEISGKMQSNYLILMDDLERLSYEQMRHLFALRETAGIQIKNLQLLYSDAQLIISATKESATCRVDPDKTIASLQQAEENICVLKKMRLNVVDTLDDDDDETSERFSLCIHENIPNDVKAWASLIDSRKHQFYFEKVDNFDFHDCSDAESSEETNDCPDAVGRPNETNEDCSNTSSNALRVVKIPPAQNQELVYVTLVSSPDDFYIQRHSDHSQLTSIEQSLKAFSYSAPLEKDRLTCVCLDELCAACTSSRKWCRAKVTRIIKNTEKQDGKSMMESVVARSKDEVEIFLIDCGKMMKTRVSCLRALPDKFHHIPPLAFPCSLIGIRPNTDDGVWNEKTIQLFAKIVSNRPVLMTTLKRESGRRYVDLHKPAPDEIDRDVPVSVRDALVFMHLARFTSDSERVGVEWPQEGRLVRRDYFKPTVVPIRSSVDVVLSHYQSISKFYVQQLGSSAIYLEELSGKIQKFVGQKMKGGFDPASPFTVLKPFVNMPCLAKYDCCKMWFRAKVLKVLEEEKKVHVYYVDYGNDAFINVKELLKIPDEFMKLPYQGLECKLADISPIDAEEWEQESLDRFFELVGEEQVKMMPRSYDNGVYSVELFDWTESTREAANQLSINERLVHEGLASGLTAHKVVEKVEEAVVHDVDAGTDECDVETDESKPPPPVVPAPPSPPSRDRSQVTVVHCVSPALFFTQSDEQWQASNKLTRELNKVVRGLKECEESSKDDPEWDVGMMCTIHSNIEKRWCRGMVREINEDSLCVVQLLDFGFSESTPSTSLFSLPDRFSSHPPHVTQCFIANIQPAGGKKWSPTAQEAFQEMVLKKKCNIQHTLEYRTASGSLPVKLYLPSVVDDVDVGRELILRGVALPVFRIDFSQDDSQPSQPLSKVQLEFERSKAAYQEAENLQEKGEVPLSTNGAVPCGTTSIDTTCTNEDLASVGRVDSEASIAPSSVDVNEERRSTSNEKGIPYYDSVITGSVFRCVISHIEKYNLFYVKKLPVKRVLPVGCEFVSGIPTLMQYEPGTPCLAQYHEDGQWYRAEVICSDEKLIHAFYVDYGLTQSISDPTKLLIIPEEYRVSPRQAIPCCVPSMPTIAEVAASEDQYMTLLANEIGKKEFVCTVDGTEDVDEFLFTVDLHMKVDDDDVTLSQLLSTALTPLSDQ